MTMKSVTSDSSSQSSSAPLILQYWRKSKEKKVKDMEFESLFGDSIRKNRDYHSESLPVPQVTHSHVTIEFIPSPVSIPEPEAYRIRSDACIVRTDGKTGLYFQQNAEWKYHDVEPLELKIVENLYRASKLPANQRGRKVMELATLCETKNERSAQSAVSKCIRNIMSLCEDANIAPLLVQGDDRRWYFNVAV